LWASVLDNASSATSKEVTRPELNTVAIDVAVSNGEAICAITACDGEVEYRENTSVLDWDLGEDSDFTFYVPVELFKTALHGWSGKATLELTDTRFTYRCGRLRVALPYTTEIDVKYLSGQDEASFSPVFIGTLADFKSAASGAAWLIPSRTSNEILKGLYLSIQDTGPERKLTMVSSDGIGMVVVRAEHQWIAEDSPDLILPPKLISVVTSTKTANKEPTIELQFSPEKKWVIFRITGDEIIEIRGRLISGKYPDWQKFYQPAVSPDNNKVSLNTKELYNELTKLNMLAYAQGADFTRFEFTFDEEYLTFDAVSTASDITDQMSLEDRMVDLSVSDVRAFSVDTGLVSRFLGTSDKEEVRISYTTAMSPVGFITYGEDESVSLREFVLMPCRK
jgi:DNA polymerase III sliding clamp (beta) subunit (PCNA family)